MSRKDVQRKLAKLGLYSGRIDGIIGPKSKRAIKAFQRANGLVIDGIAGSKTKAKLAKAVLPAPIAKVDLGKRSERNLQGVHPDLVKVVRRAADLSDIDFIVTEGVRTIERQRELVAKGASKTMRSRHLTGHAVDVAMKVGGMVRWDWPLYERFSKFMKQAARELGVKITWGGDWRSFKDGPHYQLQWSTYPA